MGLPVHPANLTNVLEADRVVGTRKKKAVQHPAYFNLRHLLVPLPLSPPSSSILFFASPFLFPVEGGAWYRNQSQFQAWPQEEKKKATGVPHF